MRVLTARAHRPEPRLVSALDLLLGVLELPPMVLISSALKELSLYQFWGTVAEQDPVSGLFHFPLTLTAVRPGSDAAAEGLRAGDQIVCWSSTSGSKFHDVDVLHDGNQQSARKFVDEATQNWLQAGGQCTVRVRLAPRCLQYPRCNGAIVECMDAFDFSRVCDECGMQQRSSMISSKADFNDCCRTAVPQAESSAVAETVVGRNAGAASATALQRAGKPGVGKENEEARKDLCLAQQRDKAREDISRYGEALQLSDTAKQEALRLFNLVADSNMVGGKVTRLTDGGKINTYKATVLASILIPGLFSKHPIPTPAEDPIVGPIEPFFVECNPRPKFNFEYREKGPHGSPNSIEAVTQDSAVIFEVKSGSGIGSGKIKLVEGHWPKKVLVRLHLGGLEGFSVSNCKKTIPRSGLKIRMLDPKGNPVEGKYLLKKKGYYEATVPPPLLGQDVKELQISWVDFYRR